MQEPGKIKIKTNVKSNKPEKHMSFTITNKLSFIDIFQFLSSSLDSLVKNLSKNGFEYQSQGIDNNVLDLVKQNGLYPYEYMSDLEKVTEEIARQIKVLQFFNQQKH